MPNKLSKYTVTPTKLDATATAPIIVQRHEPEQYFSPQVHVASISSYLPAFVFTSTPLGGCLLVMRTTIVTHCTIFPRVKSYPPVPGQHIKRSPFGQHIDHLRDRCGVSDKLVLYVVHRHEVHLEGLASSGSKNEGKIKTELFVKVQAICSGTGYSF